jgi:hypothetical protein
VTSRDATNQGSDEHCDVTQSAYGAHGPPGPHALEIAPEHAPVCAASRHEPQLAVGALGDEAQNVDAHVLPQTLGSHAQPASAEMKPS